MQNIGQQPSFQRPSGKLYLGTDQLNLIDTVQTIVDLDTIPAAYKDGIEIALTHRITPGIAGFYSIFGQIKFINDQDNKRYAVMIAVSDVPVVVNYALSNAITSCTPFVGLPNHYLSDTDYVQLWAVSYSGDNNTDIEAGELSTFLSVQRVR